VGSKAAGCQVYGAEAAWLYMRAARKYPQLIADLPYFTMMPHWHPT
jgi:hypothetical protein